jgi:hypothetical protein
VAATERQRFGRIVLAACALPGVIAAGSALAEEAPEHGVIEFKLSGYSEWQPASSSSTATSSGTTARAASAATVSAASGGGSSGGSSSSTSGASKKVDRVKVTTPSVYALVPLGRDWSLEGSGTIDNVSGASPTYYSDTDSFVTFKDTRRAADAKVTRYFRRMALALGGATSRESDYLSNAVSTEARFSTEDQNTTFNLGLGLTKDTINPSTHVVTDARKRTHEYQVGLTQALTRYDLVQLGYTRSQQSGYLNDPYKSWDVRPDSRDANIVQLRWNHWLGGPVLKTGYRYYRDTFGIRAHTVDLALSLPFGDGDTSTFTPELRWYTQSAARFYVPVNTASASYPTPADTSVYTTLDQRLSAYGAVTVGGKLEWPLSGGWSMNVKADYYYQDKSLRLLGEGSKGLASLSAAIWQVGAKYAF